jgi:two-component system sensor kinase FixL
MSMSKRKGGESSATAAGTAASEDHEQLLREQAVIIAHYRKMFDRASAMARIGVWECDLATEALTWTDAVYDLFELPPGSEVPRNIAVSMYEDDSRFRMEAARAKAIEEGSGFSLDVLIRTATGKEKWLRLTADIEMEDGRAVRIFGTKQDISEEKAGQEKLKLLQAELVQLSRQSAMAAMADTLAHELNQPLTAIANYTAGTRRALDRGASNDQFRDSFEAIERSSLKAGEIIRSLKAMSSGDAMPPQLIDPNPVIREATSLAMVGEEKDIEVSYALADGVRVLADPVQIQQVVINLVKNAVEATEQSIRREIRVSSEATDGQVTIRVEDSGSGIVPEMIGTLFDSFVSTKLDGSGIGLAISRTIVEAHGGRIFAANRPEGGAAFSVVLPLGRQDSAPEDGAGSAMRLAS